MNTLLVVGLMVAGGGGETADKRGADKLRKQLVAEMEKKALLPEDLPDDGAALLKRADSAKKRRDWPQAVEHYTTLREAVAEITVDRSFIEAKMKRLQDSSRDVTFTDSMKGLLAKMSEAHMEARFVAANQTLNQLYKELAKLPRPEVTASVTEQR